MKSFLAGLLLFACAAAKAQLPQNQIFHMNNPAVFMLVATEPGGASHTGSAFCLRQDGILVTTLHTVANAAAATAISVFGKHIPVLGTLAASPEHDLAILKINDAGLSEVQLGQSEYIRAGEQVTVVAPSAPGTNTFFSGKISPEYKLERAAEEYQPLIPVQGTFLPRYNGAPLLSGSGGRAMGVLLTTDNDSNNYNVALAIPVEEVRVLMNAMANAPQPLAPNGKYFSTKYGEYWAGRLDEVNGNQTEAISHYTAALRDDPQYFPALFQSAYDAELRGDHESAKSAYTNARRYPQTASIAAYNLGLINFAANDMAGAEGDLQAAVAANGSFLKAYDMLGKTYEKEKQPDNALEAYRQAHNINETDIFSNLRIAHILFDEQKWREAAKAAKTAREAGVDSVDVYLIESDSYFHVRDYLQAWDLANRGTELRAGANLPRLWYIMAASDMKTKQPDRAQTELAKLKTLDPALAEQLQSAGK